MTVKRQKFNLSQSDECVHLRVEAERLRDACLNIKGAGHAFCSSGDPDKLKAALERANEKLDQCAEWARDALAGTAPSDAERLRDALVEAGIELERGNGAVDTLGRINAALAGTASSKSDRLRAVNAELLAALERIRKESRVAPLTFSAFEEIAGAAIAKAGQS